MTDRPSARIRQLAHTPLSRHGVYKLADEVAQLESRVATPAAAAAAAPAPADERGPVRKVVEKYLADLDEPRLIAEAIVREPLTYEAGNGQSYFYDCARIATGLGDVKGARSRLADHQREMRAIMPSWHERRRRLAELAYEQAMTRSAAEVRALERMETLGLRRFTETRAIDRTPGQAGYFDPPLYLLEAWVPAPRAGRPFADLWPTLPLAPGTDSINIPRLTTGTGAGPQGSDAGAMPTRDPVDSAIHAQVVTIGGQADVSMQWAEQTAPPGADQFVFRDLMADIDGNEDGQLIIGNGFPLLNGAWPGGSLSAANHVLCANTNNGSTSTQTWVNGGTASSFNQAGNVYSSVARMLSAMHRSRGLAPTHVLLAPWLWWSLASTTDNAGRPLVNCTAHAPQLDATDGAAGTAWSLPCVLDDNVPTTWDGSVVPSMAGVSAGVASPGAGSGSYSVVLAVRAPDLLLFEGIMRTRLLREVVSGSGLWRFQAYRYAASTAGRYTAGTAISASTSYDATSVNVGASSIVGATSQYESNGILSLANWGG
jgi:hypothetical protein